MTETPAKQLVVEYLDGQTRYYPVDQRGWSHSMTGEEVVVGRGLPRTHIPLRNVAAYRIETTEGEQIARADAERLLAEVGKVLAKMPRIVVLCGSTRFSEAFRTANLAETLAGRIVLSVGCDMRSDGELFAHLSEAEVSHIKAGLDELHLRKIDMADEVLILNVGGYIGDSTRKEIDYAISRGKTLRWLEPGREDTPEALAERMGSIRQTDETAAEKPFFACKAPDPNRPGWFCDRTLVHVDSDCHFVPADQLPASADDEGEPDTITFHASEYADKLTFSATPSWLAAALESGTVAGVFQGEDYWYLRVKTADGIVMAEPGDTLSRHHDGGLLVRSPDGLCKKVTGADDEGEPNPICTHCGEDISYRSGHWRHDNGNKGHIAEPDQGDDEGDQPGQEGAEAENDPAFRDTDADRDAEMAQALTEDRCSFCGDVIAIIGEAWRHAYPNANHEATPANIAEPKDAPIAPGAPIIPARMWPNLLTGQ